jgi:CheY-like chemotaxis protein
MLTEYLAFQGLSVLEAADGESAIELARQHHPALILMDLQMPNVDGWEATRRLKADPATRDIIVVAITAQTMPPDEGNTRQAGCDGFIAKPFDIVGVGDAVANIVARGRRGLRAIDALKPPTGKSISGPRSPGR